MFGLELSGKIMFESSYAFISGELNKSAIRSCVAHLRIYIGKEKHSFSQNLAMILIDQQFH